MNFSHYQALYYHKADTIYSSNVGSMLGQRHSHWTNVEPTLGQRLVSSGYRPNLLRVAVSDSGMNLDDYSDKVKSRMHSFGDAYRVEQLRPPLPPNTTRGDSASIKTLSSLHYDMQ